MNKYLVKIAEQSEKLTSAQRVIAGGGLGYILGSEVAHLSNEPILRASGKHNKLPLSVLTKITREHKNVTFSKYKAMKNADLDDKLKFRKGTRQHGPSYWDHHVIEGYGSKSGKAYIQGKYGGGSPKNHFTLLHELGHAKDYQKRGLLTTAKRYLEGATSLIHNSKVGLGVGAGMLASDKTKDKAWLVPLAVRAPILRSEFMANVNAHASLGRHAPHLQRAYGNYAGKQLWGYLAAPIAQSGVLYALGHQKDKK